MDSRREPVFEGCRVYQGEDAIKALTSMSLRVSYFDQAVNHGINRASRVDEPVYPKVLKGQMMWGATLAGLRTALLEASPSFKIGRSQGYETAYHAEKAFGIAVVGGDVYTGEDAFRHPKTARRRGPVTAERIARNAWQPTLPGLEMQGAEDEQCETWFLLLNSRKTNIYRELSLPFSIGPDGKVGLWSKRILMSPVPLRGVNIEAIEDGPGPDDGEGPQVNVERK